MKRPCVYIRSNRKNGTLYVGVSADICRRSFEHEVGLSPDSFVARHGLVRLVYFEPQDSMVAAIAREKALKDLPRGRKVKLIERENPEWEDLTGRLAWGD